MELLVGTEPRREYYAFEAAAAAQKMLSEIMLVKSDENVVITADTQSDWRVVEATAQAAMSLGAHPTVVWYETRPRAQMEPYPPVAAAVQAADVWIEYAVQYTLYTDARRTACEKGCRYAAFGGLDVDALVRTIGQVDYSTMLAMGERLVALTQNTEECRITTALGTDLHCNNKGAEVWQSGCLGDEPGVAVMLGGQVVWLPQESSVNGTIVGDGMVWPPDDVGVVREPVTLRVEGGRITSIDGGVEARILTSWLDSLQDPTMMRIAHSNYGFNPGVTRFTGRVAEDERVFGVFVFGFGGWMDRPAASHFDVVITAPTIVIDDVEIEREGKYTHPELVAFCRKMGVAGYSGK
jgi:leucyl aminopeptidase (aminopeptidase T)